jgi:hypothetical protein
MTVGIGLGISQLCGNPVFQSFGDKVFQPFSLFVHFIPWEIEHVMKKPFQQSVMTQDFQCAVLPSLGQDCAVMLFIADKSRLQPCQPLEHTGHRRSSYVETFSQSIARNPPLLRSTEFQDCFQVIVN